MPAVVQVLAKLPTAAYQATWISMRAGGRGIPHSRSRVYIVGIRAVALSLAAGSSGPRPWR